MSMISRDGLAAAGVSRSRMLLPSGMGLIFWAMLGSAVGWAQERTPFPEFTGARVYVAPDVPGAEAYKGLDDVITDVEQGSSQNYYVVVVGSTGPGSTASRDYADALIQDWLAQAKRKGIGLDTSRSVLIVVSLGNKQVSLNPGSELQSRFGLEGGTIDRELVRPGFVPEARAGNFAGAIGTLVRATDDWIAKRDPNSKQLRAEAASRASQVKQDAANALAEASRALEAARAELLEKKNAGLGVEEDEQILTEAARTLESLVGRSEGEPRVVLREAQQARQAVQGVIEDLRERSLQQVEAALLLEELPGQVTDLEGKVTGAKEKGLPTSAVSQAIGTIKTGIEGARGLLTSDPRQALSQSNSLVREVGSTNQLLGELPALQTQRNAAANAVKPLEAEVKSAIEEAAASGADVEAIQERFEETSRVIKSASRPDPGDPRRAVSQLEASRADLQEMLELVNGAKSRHRLYAKILPLTLLGVAAIGTLLVLGLVRVLHLQAKKSATEKLKVTREQSTVMMERLDALKEQHKLLPVTDDDFQQPMAGMTLELYESVQVRLRKLWDRWLQIMEVVDDADKLVGEQSPLGVNRLKQAEELLSREAQTEESEQIEAGIKADLERLTQAHEHARASLEGFSGQVEELNGRLGTLSAAGVPVTPYEPDQGAAKTLVEKAEAILVADPLGAKEIIDRAQERMDSLSHRVGEVHERFQSAQKTRSEIDSLKNRVAKLRGEGLKLAEEEGNPDRPILAASRGVGEAMDALHAGDAATAAQRADLAGASLREAGSMVERVLEARASSEQQVQTCRAENRRLEGELSGTSKVQQELDRDFARSSWQSVAKHPETIKSGLQQCETEIDRAAALADTKEQRYLESSRRLESVRRFQEESAGLIKAHAEMLAGLRQVREECRKEAGELETKARQVRSLFEQNGGLGSGPRNTLAAAEDASRRLEEAMSQNPPDWLAIRQWAARADESYKIAREQAEVEIKYRREVLNQLNELSQRADRLGTALRNEDKDRPPANLRYRAAIESLARVARDAQSNSADWRGMASELEDVATDLKKSEALANEDIQQANQAIAEISSASRVLRQANTFSSVGYSPDLSSSQGDLKAAQEQLQRQDYEQAIKLANSSEHKSRTAYRAAEEAARYRQQQIESERRRRARMESARRGSPLSGMGPLIAGAAISVLMDAAEAAAGTGGRSSFGGGSFGGGFTSGGSSRGSSSSGTSSSSWSSGTSSSGW